MMTAKEKAQELLTKYTIATWIKFNEIKYLTKIPTAKQCALIAVDEILKVLFQHHEIDYWKQVKKQIELL